jgi:hypothetical protein
VYERMLLRIRNFLSVEARFDCPEPTGTSPQKPERGERVPDLGSWLEIRLQIRRTDAE